ncbi:MAG: hypothetical protein ACJ71F_06410 [Nitrososphaeraceae archaeon]
MPTRIRVVATLAFSDIETNKNASTIMIINAVNNMPKNFLKFSRDISFSFYF